MKLSKSIIKPIVTEKSLAGQEKGLYTFQVTMNTSAGLIKDELKKVFGVDVVSVHTIVLPGKKRRMGKSARFKKTAQRKKLIVELKEGQKLDIFPAEAKK